MVVHAGADAAGIHVNGEKSDAAPDLTEVLPVLPEEDDDEGPAHDVIAGGNTLVNEAYVSFSLAEAPLIAVMGDSLSLASISQVSVISDLDTVNGMLWGAGGADNIVDNVASLLTISSEPESDEDSGTTAAKRTMRRRMKRRPFRPLLQWCGLTATWSISTTCTSRTSCKMMTW